MCDTLLESGFFAVNGRLGSGTQLPIRETYIPALGQRGRADMYSLYAGAGTGEPPVAPVSSNLLAVSGISNKGRVEEQLQWQLDCISNACSHLGINSFVENVEEDLVKIFRHPGFKPE